jgi:acyl transferase domain-containing protein
MGCMFPQAEDLARYWANIRDRVDAITDVPESHWRVADYHDDDPKAVDRTYARRGGFLSPVDFPLLEFGIAPHSLEATDTTQLLGLMVARAALDDAGYPESRSFERDKVSVILGVSGTLELVIPLGARLGQPIWRRALEGAGVDARTAEDVIERIASSYVGWQEGSFPGLLGNVAAGRIANRLDLGGTNCVVDAACASSLGALELALLELSTGRCDLAVTGGIDTFNDIFVYMCFSKTPALSPTGDARPFDADADGTILGEGLGLVILKRLADAERDGDRIYAVIRSIGASSDGKGQAVYAPSAAGQVKALRRAYDLAGIAPESVELLEAHGTGTKVGDATELAALDAVYGNERRETPWCALGSVKSQVGHTKAAAGAAGLIKAAMALYHKVLPPTSKVRRPLERLARGHSPFYVNAEARPWLTRTGQPRRAAVSAFGFGGSNFHCVLEEASPDKTEIDWDGDVQIVGFSAENRRGIEVLLDQWAVGDDWTEFRREAALSRSRFRPDHHYRMLIVAERGKTDLAAVLAAARDRLESSSIPGTNGSPARVAPTPAGGDQPRVFVGVGDPPGQLAMLFPGQGSQYAGMLRDLACRFPRMQCALDLANETGADSEGLLSDCIYPRTAFEDEYRQAQELKLRETQLAQPAIGAVSLGLLHILDEFGVRADVVGGHSFGELTALHAAGAIDDRSFLQLSRLRGALMARRPAGADPGAMLAVFGEVEAVQAVLSEARIGVVVANRNAPRQLVLSGRTREIERATRLLREKNIKTHSIAVSGAFHSPLVASAEAPLREALESIPFEAPNVPVFANTTAAPYPPDRGRARELLAGQLARPVEFVAEVEAMYRHGARTFLEVGPDAKLTALVRIILEGRQFHALALDASRGSSGNVFDLACSLASLAALGYAVDLDHWDPADRGQAPNGKRTGLTARICGANVRPKAASNGEPIGETATVHTGLEAVDRERFLNEKAPPLSSADDLMPAHDPQLRAPARIEIERTMNPLEGPTRSDHRNGQADGLAPARDLTSHRHGGLEPVREQKAPEPVQPGLPAALEQARASLVALQRLAEQTAALHRQFLEGQEKTQNTFLKLLEHEQRLSAAIRGRVETGARELTVPAVQARDDTKFVSGAAVPRLAEPTPPQGHHQSATTPPSFARAPAMTARNGEASHAATEGLAEAQSLAGTLIEVVADKTGYPAEVLDLDMQLDSDLGIDSIKRVEILSALQDRLPGLAPIEPETLGSFRTLRSIAERLVDDNPVAHFSRSSASGKEADGIAAPGGEIARILLETVADKTGYPIDILELGMRLDTDLGIDSIKRVEIFSAIQDRLPDAPRPEPEQIGTLATLGEIALFLAGKSARPENGDVSSLGVNSYTKARSDSVGGQVEKTTTEKLDHPNGVVPLDGHLATDFATDSILDQRHPRARSLDRQAPREEIRLPAGAMVWVVSDGSHLTEAVRLQVQKRGYSCRVFTLAQSWPESIDGLGGLIILAPADPRDEEFMGRAFRLLRACGAALEASSSRGGSALVTVARLDGAFGVNSLANTTSPTSGALAGMVKTAAHEWPGVHCKALDVDAGFEPAGEAAAWIVEEMLLRGPSEVGLSRAGIVTIELEQGGGLPQNGRHARPLEKGDLVVISGGARGITADVACALAEAFQPRLVLFGRAPAPMEEPQWLVGLHEEADVKRSLLERSTRRLAPSELAAEARQVMAQREIRRNLARIAAAGSPVVYLSLDVRDRDAVRANLVQVRHEFGPVRGLIHGAGVLADRRIIEQTDAQFALVYDTKVKGIHHLFDSVDHDSLRFLAVFSSSTARFGRVGQVAYAAANEYLNKWAQLQADRLPRCRVVSFNWGPWSGGMVTDTLKLLFEKEGVSLIPPRQGGKLVADLATGAGGSAVELIVLAGKKPLNSNAPATTVSAARPVQDQSLGRVFRRSVDLESLPVLASHVIDGHAVLPVAMILEWMAEGAVHRNPGLVVCGVDDFRLFKGVILGEGQTATVDLWAGKAVRRGDEFVVPVELRGTLGNGKHVAHARASIVLGDRHGSQVLSIIDKPLPAYARSRAEIYQSVLFHGPAMQAIDSVDGCGPRAIAGWVSTAPEPAEWIDQPVRSAWLVDPLAIDGAFQLVGLWTREQLGFNSLPTGLGSLRQFRREYPTGVVRVMVEIRQSSSSRAVADIEILDDSSRPVARLDGFECVVDASLNQAFRRNRLPSAVSVVSS